MQYRPYPNLDYVLETSAQVQPLPIYLLHDLQAVGPKYGGLDVVCGPITDRKQDPETGVELAGVLPMHLVSFSVFARQPRERLASCVHVDLADGSKRMSPIEAGEILVQLGFDPQSLYTIIAACGWPVPVSES